MWVSWRVLQQAEYISLKQKHALNFADHLCKAFEILKREIDQYLMEGRDWIVFQIGKKTPHSYKLESYNK